MNTDHDGDATGSPTHGAHARLQRTVEVVGTSAASSELPLLSQSRSTRHAARERDRNAPRSVALRSVNNARSSCATRRGLRRPVRGLVGTRIQAV